MKSSVLKAFCFLLAGTLLQSCVLFPTDYYIQQERNPYQKGVLDFNSSNFQGALEKFKGPAEDGNIDAQYLTGLIHLYALTGERNTYLAEKWLNLAASGGHTAAQVQLAYLYQDRYTPLYNPYLAYHWFSIVVGDRPEYKSDYQNLRWTLQTQGRLQQAESLDLPKPKFVYYHGIDYNNLFPPK